MAVFEDFIFDFDTRIIQHVSGTTVYTVNQLYSYAQDLSDDVINSTYTVPMSAQTPTEYTLVNSWFIPEDSFKYLKGGAISTSGWDATIYNSGIWIMKFSTYTNCIPSDIGTTVTDGTNVGILVDYNNTLKKWWVRKVSGNTWAGTVSGTGSGGGLLTSVVTGESLFSNIYSLGLLAAGTTNTIYVEQVNPELTNNKIAQYWPAGHIDLVIKVKEANTLIDSGNLTVFCREYTDLYSHYKTDVSSGGRNPVPLGTADDSNNQTPEATVATWNDVIISFGSYSVDLNNGAGPRPYTVEIDCGSRTSIQQVYERLKYVTARSSTINLDGQIGALYTSADPSYVESVQAPFGTFAGGTFFGAQGVYLKNIPVADINFVQFIDATGVSQSYPFTASGVISFNDVLKNDVNAVYRMYFASTPAGDFNTANAVLVEDANGNQIYGKVNGQSSISFSFNYDQNAQGGRTPGTNAPVKVVGIGLSGSQYILVDTTLTRSVGQTIQLQPVAENNYVSS